MTFLFWGSLTACDAWFSRPPAPAGTAWVPLLFREVPAGVEVGADDVEWLALPVELVPDGLPATPEEFVGRRTRDRLLRNEVLRSERLGPEPGRWGHVGWVVPGPEVVVAPDESKVFAIVAARDLAPGTVVLPTDLYAVHIPERFLPAGVFLSPELVAGTTVCERVLAHEWVRTERIAPAGTQCPPAR